MSESPPSRLILLIGDDLNAIARVEAAARAAGAAFSSLPPTGLGAKLPGEAPALVVVDLDAGGSAVLHDLLAVGSGIERARIVAFFSHVDEAAGRGASALGIKALPRGRFWREVGALAENALRPYSPPGES